MLMIDTHTHACCSIEANRLSIGPIEDFTGLCRSMIPEHTESDPLLDACCDVLRDSSVIQDFMEDTMHEVRMGLKRKKDEHHRQAESLYRGASEQKATAIMQATERCAYLPPPPLRP